MIDKITIENYKSIEKLTLQLGRINVLIGENGCGKSNILEAIAMYSAAINDKLDNEFLASRGIRITQDPKFMRSAFNQENVDKEIKIEIQDNHLTNICILHNDNQSPYSNWIDQSNPLHNPTALQLNLLDQNSNWLTQTNPFQNLKVPDALLEQLRPEVKDSFAKIISVLTAREIVKTSLGIGNFLIYSPENAALRTFAQEGQILPLGIKGEGLFQLIKVLCSDNKYADKVKELKGCMELIGWFKDFQLPETLSRNEHALNIQDKYIDDNLKYFDQNSANEGFLFLLFYFCLFISDKTPNFFAIDNIDASLNPKLCRELMKRLIILATKYEKQVIFTTHNPAILDGLNLDDENQKLFIISRNSAGHTKAQSFVKPKPIKGAEPVRLSEAFLRGYIGGLPKNF